MKTRAAQVDRTVKTLAAALSVDKTSIAIAATGGYGRGELAPFSDVDLLILIPRAEGGAARAFVETFIAALWEKGLKPGPVARTPDECAAALSGDLHFLTSLLDRRFLCGDRTLYAELDRVFRAHRNKTPKSAFIRARLAERDARHRKMGDTRFQLEPNVKEGKGALRDIQDLLWLSRYLYGVKTPAALAKRGVLTTAEAATLQQAHDFFWNVRCHLHAIAGRADDRLSFDAQPEAARRMGYAQEDPTARAEAFMKDYFLMTSETGHLTRTLCAALEADALATSGTAGTRRMTQGETAGGFPLVRNRLSFPPAAGGKGHLAGSPENAVLLFRASQSSGHDIHPDALRAIRAALPALRETLPGNRAAHAAFLDILLHEKAEQTLRHMNEAGLLAALIPAFGNIVAHMQYDMYHVYTADEHTLHAIGALHRLEQGAQDREAPLPARLARSVDSRRALYVAMLLHDVAKGTGGDHARKGAAVARQTAPLLGLAPAEAETAAWLVENHLLMTHTAYKRDLDDPQTLDDFTRAVQSPARLRLLTVMTAADIMAVGPGRWNSWRAGLLAALYGKAERILSGAGADGAEEGMIAQKKARRIIGRRTAVFNMLSDHAPPAFWQVFPPESIARFAAALDGRTQGAHIHVTPLPGENHTEVMVWAPDRKGLFATLAGAMAAAGASIAQARIFTLSNGFALDVFCVQNLAGEAYDNAPFLKKTLKAALAGKAGSEEEIARRHMRQPRRARMFRVAPHVVIDNRASAAHTLIEVHGRDHPGFLHDITRALSGQRLHVATAKIATFGARAVDVFYVKDDYGMKILHNEKLRAVRDSLLAAIG